MNRSNDRARRPLPVCGCWVNLFEPAIGELIGLVGYDCAMLDMEHTPVGIERVATMVRAVQLGGAKALVRAPDGDPRWIGRLMDLGADGAMVPMVESAAEAERLAAAARFAPEGTRGMAAFIVRASGYGQHLGEYLRRCRDDFLLIAQIETRRGVEHAAEVAAVDGIDALFVGPYDLSGSLGRVGEPDHRDTRAAVARVLRAVRASDTPLATLPTARARTRDLFARGFSLVFSGSDVTLLREAMARDVAAARRAFAAGKGRS